jgi:hypothetical protein
MLVRLQIIAHKAPPNPLALHGLVECSPPGSSGHMLTRVSGLITLEVMSPPESWD